MTKNPSGENVTPVVTVRTIVTCSVQGHAHPVSLLVDHGALVLDHPPEYQVVDLDLHPLSHVDILK